MADEPRLPRTHLLWSALACVVFFLPLGLVAVGFGIGTQRAISRGEVVVDGVASGAPPVYRLAR